MLVFLGCKTPYNESAFAGSFDSARVAKLSHECFQVAYDAKQMARWDNKFSVVRTNHLDRDVVVSLGRISVYAPSIAREVESHPESPRTSSKHVYDVVAVYAALLKSRYYAESFKPATQAKIAQLLSMLEEIGSFYQVATDVKGAN